MRSTILRFGQQCLAQAFYQSFLIGDCCFQFRNLMIQRFQAILVGSNAIGKEFYSFKIGSGIHRRQGLSNSFADLFVFLRSFFLVRDGFDQLRCFCFSKMLRSDNVTDNLAFLFLRKIVDRGERFQRKGRQHFFRNSVGNCLCQCRNLRNITNRLLFQDILNGLDIQ